MIATVVLGSTKVFIKGHSVAIGVGLTLTTLGQIITSTMNSTKVTVENQPIILGGSVTNLASGYSNGLMIALGAIGVSVV